MQLDQLTGFPSRIAIRAAGLCLAVALMPQAGAQQGGETPSEPVRAQASAVPGVYLAAPAPDGLTPCRIVLADPATLPEGLSADGREVSGLAMADPGCSGPLAETALWTLDADRARLALIGMGGEPVAELGAMPGGIWSGRIEELGVIRLEKVQDRD
jgi:hypothetical protein